MLAFTTFDRKKKNTKYASVYNFLFCLPVRIVFHDAFYYKFIKNEDFSGSLKFVKLFFKIR